MAFFFNCPKNADDLCAMGLDGKCPVCDTAQKVMTVAGDREAPEVNAALGVTAWKDRQ
jgi:hypothetical protein